jgi:Zinc carboxypeptidase
MSMPFVDTYFENGSPLRWERLSDGSMRIEPVHDYERVTGNRASTHWNFKLHVPPEMIGQRLTIVMPGTDNIWNGQRIPSFEGGRLNVAVSCDKNHWHTVPGHPLDSRCYGFSYELELNAAMIQVARNVPYTITDLNRRLKKITGHPMVRSYAIGATVEGRELEIVELGNPDASRQVFFRAAAHPWESGGTWFLDGMMQFLTGANGANELLRNVCFCLMPMANKDGVFRGMSRFNVRGMDLNRNWFKDRPADPILSPENACLENWLRGRQAQGKSPLLAIDLHNDCDGKMHLGPHDADPKRYRQRMGILERTMRELTWFREGSVEESFRGSMAGGFIETFGIDSLIYELHSEWAQGLGRAPLHTDWQQLGASFTRVVDRYFQQTFNEASS